MASRMKEDEKNEKIIRGLLKLPANRRCINCNNLGPQYVCINFWTFICTNCSGMHREFTHRVKSISMAKFTSQEVISLREGGNERTLSSSSMGSTDGTSTQLKGTSSGSLIDFSADPEPPAPQTPQQSVPQRSTSAPADGVNWASFDTTIQQIASQPRQAAPTATTIESALFQLSDPGSGHGDNMPTLPVSTLDSSPKATDGPMMQQLPPSTYPASNNQFINPQFSASTSGAVNQSLGSSYAANLQVPFASPTGRSSQETKRRFEEKSVGLSSQSPIDAKSNGRKELPEDLFTFTYPSAPTSTLGWQRGPHVGIAYGMQYPTGMMIPTVPHAPKSSNPFDLLNDPASVQSPGFPSVASLQGALPNVTGVSSLSHTTSLGTAPLPWTPPQQVRSYPPVATQSPYIMQQVPGNMPYASSNTIPALHQGIRGSGFGAHFGSSTIDQLPAARFSQPGTPNSFGPVGSNPFG